MNNNLEKVLAFLDDAQTYYLATVEGDQPRVRPFGTALGFVHTFNGNKIISELYIPDGFDNDKCCEYDAFVRDVLNGK